MVGRNPLGGRVGWSPVGGRVERIADSMLRTRSPRNSWTRARRRYRCQQDHCCAFQAVPRPSPRGARNGRCTAEQDAAVPREPDALMHRVRGSHRRRLWARWPNSRHLEPWCHRGLLSQRQHQSVGSSESSDLGGRLALDELARPGARRTCSEAERWKHECRPANGQPD